MNNTATHQQVKLLIKKGKTKEAIDLLIQLLEERQNIFPKFYNEAIQLKARYLRANRKLSMGLMKAEDADLIINQVNDACLQLLDNLQEKFDLSNVETAVPQRKKGWEWVVGSLTIAVLLLLAFYWLQQNKQSIKLPAHCPPFEVDTNFNVMILPYESLTSTASSNVHQLIEQRFNLLADQFALPISIGLGKMIDAYPKRYEEANSLASECNAQLIVWGSEVDTLVITRYKFVGLDSTFKLKLLIPGKGTSIDGIETPTNILTKGEVTKPIEDELITLLIGIGSIRNNIAAGFDLLEQVKIDDTTDINAFLMKEMHLAENLILKNDEAQSVVVYNKVLNAHPNYFFARLNRGVLHWSQGAEYKALSDLTIAIQLKPQNIIAHYSRGRVLFDMNQLGIAKLDVEKAKQLSLQDSTNTLTTKYRTDYILPLQVEINKQITDVQREINSLKSSLRNAEENILPLQNQLLQAYLKIGEQKKARTLVQEIKAIDNTTLSHIKDHYAAAKVSNRIETATFWLAYIPNNNSESTTAVIE